MITSTTKMSQNGQVVIPKELREQANLKKGTQFLVMGDGNNILLKTLNENELREEAKLLEKLAESEENLRKGEYVTVDFDKMSIEEIDEILTDEKKWKSHLHKNLRKTFRKSKTKKQGRKSLKKSTKSEKRRS